MDTKLGLEQVVSALRQTIDILEDSLYAEKENREVIELIQAYERAEDYLRKLTGMIFRAKTFEDLELLSQKYDRANNKFEKIKLQLSAWNESRPNSAKWKEYYQLLGRIDDQIEFLKFVRRKRSTNEPIYERELAGNPTIPPGIVHIVRHCYDEISATTFENTPDYIQKNKTIVARVVKTINILKRVTNRSITDSETQRLYDALFKLDSLSLSSQEYLIRSKDSINYFLIQTGCL